MPASSSRRSGRCDCTPAPGRRNRTWRKAACRPSGSGGTVGAVMDPSAPLATAEFLVVDTETNGLGGERCELTEVGAVLVGGGELHEEWGSLVGVAQPLGRYIQRFTGISQAMVDAAPAPEDVLPALAAQLRARVLVAHNARFDVRVLKPPFAVAAREGPDPPVICTVQLARRFAPLQRR